MKISVGSTFQLGVVTLLIGLTTLHVRFVAPEPYDVVGTQRLLWLTVVGVAATVSAYGLGLPELPTRRREAAVRALGAALCAIGVVSLAQVGLAVPLLPRFSLGLFTLLLPVWAVICWNLAHDVHSWQSQREQVFLVAEQPDEHAALTYELDNRPERPATVVGSLSTADARLGAGGRLRLLDAVEATGAGVVVLDTAAQSDDGIVQQVARLHGNGVRVRTLALFYEEWLGKLPLAELARTSLLFDIGELHRQRYVRAKRVIDVVLGLIGSAVLLPFVAVVVVGNRLGNPGPLFFTQERVGKDGRPFTMLKFRSMTPSVATAGDWTADGDPRVTAFGGFLRRSHLDELPQMLNVLKGELSIVGPRPEQPHYVHELTEKIPFYDVRHLVRPGLTGWAQVKQGYAADEADALEKFQYDVYYLRRQGLALDVRIIWRTVRDVIGAGGR
ncbi:MAG: sugar transferase [Actinomycetota bacterium]